MNTEATIPNDTHPTEWYLDHLAADTELFAQVLETGPTDRPIAACPGWDVLRLGEHVGQIHRWATFCVEHARPPSADEAAALESFLPERASDWLREGSARLAASLRRIAPEATTWHPFPVANVARVWPRRQAHETAVHRWDAQRAIGLDATIDAELASDGVDEYFEIAVPRLVARNGIELPSGSLHVHATDVDGEWLVWTDGGEYRMIRAHEKGEAALRGPAAELLLRFWGRDGQRADELSPIGDEEVLAAWLSISGM